MKVTISIETDAAGLVELAQFFDSRGLNTEPPTIVHDDGTAPVEAPKRRRGRPAKATAPEAPAPTADPVPAADEAVEDATPVAEELTADVVSNDTRAFIRLKGADGPRLALAALKKFGANKFDELTTDNYGPFLRHLKTL